MSLSTKPTFLNVIKYIFRRHSLLLKDVNIDLNNIAYEELILIAQYRGKQPHFYLPSDHLTEEFDIKHLIGIDIDLSATFGTGSKSLNFNGKELSRCTLKDFLSKDSFSTGFKKIIYKDGKLYDSNVQLSHFFAELRSKHKCSIQLSDSTQHKQTVDEYQKKADLIVKSEKWRTYYVKMVKRLRKYASIQLVWPSKSGIAQMAFNLRHYYKVICLNYWNETNFSSLLFDKYCPLYTSWGLNRMPKLWVAISKMSVHYKWECGERVEPTLSEIIDVQDRSIGLFDILFQYLAKYDGTQGNWMEYTNKMKIKGKDVIPMSIREFKAKYSPEFLAEYLLFFEEISSGYFVARYLPILLGIKVVSTDWTQAELGKPFEDLSILKWCSVSRFPLSFIVEASEITFDEELLLNRLSSHINGDFVKMKRFFTFMLKTINMSLPLVGETLLEYFVQSFDLGDRRISFEGWRDSMIQNILLDFHNDYRVNHKDVAEFLFQPWLSVPLIHYFHFLRDSSTYSESKNLFIDFEVSMEGGVFGDFYMDGIGEYSEYRDQEYDFQMLSWTSHFLYIFTYIPSYLKTLSLNQCLPSLTKSRIVLTEISMKSCQSFC